MTHNGAEKIKCYNLSMEKFYSNIVGTPVMEDDVFRAITTIKDVILDPESGKVVAFSVDLSRNLVVAPVDILSFDEFLKIHNHESIAEGNDILRVAAVQKKGIRIIHNRVESKNGEYIGIVVDFSIDPKTFTLKRILTAKSILGLIRYDQRIILAKNIIEILPNKIIVKENLKTSKEEKRVTIEDLAVSG